MVAINSNITTKASIYELSEAGSFVIHDYDPLLDQDIQYQEDFYFVEAITYGDQTQVFPCYFNGDRMDDTPLATIAGSDHHEALKAAGIDVMTAEEVLSH